MTAGGTCQWWGYAVVLEKEKVVRYGAGDRDNGTLHAEVPYPATVQEAKQDFVIE
jgi:hypothetical protein